MPSRVTMWEGKGSGGLNESPGSQWDTIPPPDSILDDLGSCRGFPQSWWFDREDMIPAAKDICSGCPVRARCLDYAMSVPQGLDFGIWGGTTRYEREKMRKRNGKH